MKGVGVMCGCDGIIRVLGKPALPKYDIVNANPLRIWSSVIRAICIYVLMGTTQEPIIYRKSDVNHSAANSRREITPGWS